MEQKMELTQRLRLTPQGESIVSAMPGSIPFLVIRNVSDYEGMRIAVGMAINFLRTGEHPSVQICVPAEYSFEGLAKILYEMLALAEGATSEDDEGSNEFSFELAKRVGDSAIFTVTREMKNREFSEIEHTPQKEI